MHTDEYEISISREIQVCHNRIERSEKAISNLQKRYEWLASGTLDYAPREPDKEAVWVKWRELHEGLNAWRQRLKEYEEAYSAIRSRKAWPNAI